MSPLEITTCVVVLLAWVLALELLVVSLQDMRQGKQQMRDLQAWDAWKRTYAGQEYQAMANIAQAQVQRVASVVAGVADGATAVLVGSYANGAFHPRHSDVDIKVTVVGPADLDAAGRALTQAGFHFKHATGRYHLYTSPASGGVPSVDVSLSLATTVDTAHCVHANSIAAETQGFLTFLAKHQYEKGHVLHVLQQQQQQQQHVAVRHWRPHRQTSA
jgi:hypothetical protein